MEDAEEPGGRHVHVLLPDPPVHARVVPRGPIAELDEVLLTDPPERWEALGLAVDGGVAQVGTIRLRFGAAEPGWRVRGLADGDIDGLPTLGSDAPAREPLPASAHPLGAVALDHVVVATPDLERTFAALEAAGLERRRVRDAGPDARQGFYLVGDAVLEVVGPRVGAPHREPLGEHEVGEGPATFWGLVLVVEDLDAASGRLGPLLGRPRDAVQPGRRIATVRREAGIGTAVALMTPRAG